MMKIVTQDIYTEITLSSLMNTKKVPFVRSAGARFTFKTWNRISGFLRGTLISVNTAAQHIFYSSQFFIR